MSRQDRQRNKSPLAVTRPPGESAIDLRRPVLAYLRGIFASLNPIERLIPDCVLTDPEKVITSSIGEIKRESGASVGSIVGFLPALRFEGLCRF